MDEIKTFKVSDYPDEQVFKYEYIPAVIEFLRMMGAHGYEELQQRCIDLKIGIN